MPHIEHLNITVPDPAKTAKMLCDLFDWRIRWSGEAIDSGHTIHVGSEDSYLALYHPNTPLNEAINTYDTIGGANHIGVVVEDLDAMEKRVLAAGFKPRAHADYEPGRRFYFCDSDGIEFEIISYAG